MSYGVQVDGKTINGTVNTATEAVNATEITTDMRMQKIPNSYATVIYQDNIYKIQTDTKDQIRITNDLIQSETYGVQVDGINVTNYGTQGRIIQAYPEQTYTFSMYDVVLVRPIMKAQSVKYNQSTSTSRNYTAESTSAEIMKYYLNYSFDWSARTFTICFTSIKNSGSIILTTIPELYDSIEYLELLVFTNDNVFGDYGYQVDGKSISLIHNIVNVSREINIDNSIDNTRYQLYNDNSSPYYTGETVYRLKCESIEYLNLFNIIIITNAMNNYVSQYYRYSDDVCYLTFLKLSDTIYTTDIIWSYSSGDNNHNINNYPITIKTFKIT